MAERRPFERPGDYEPLGVVHEPERASDADSEALWMLARLLACVAIVATVALAAQALTGAHPWAWWQVLSPLFGVPVVVIVAAFVHAYIPRGRRHG